MSDTRGVVKYIEENKEEYLEALREFLSIPSVSTQSDRKKDVAAAAAFVARRLRAMGLKAMVHKTAKHPIVTAEYLKAEGKPTALVYGHFDVQPPEPLEKWTSPPFEPTVRAGKIYARGASDDKGQMFTHILAAEAYLKTGQELPINLKFLFEGEEEIGSPNLVPFIRQHKKDLAADYVVISDTAQFDRNLPAINYGLRGITGFEITLTGPNRDLHSGSYGGAIANPIHVLAEMVAKMHDKRGRVAVPGFYKDVLPLQAWERKAFKALGDGDPVVLKQTGSPNLYGEKGFSSYERKWARPTLEVNGIGGGYQGEGGKTVIPSTAFAKVTMRLVPNQDPKKIQKKFKKFVQDICPDTVRLTFEVSEQGAGAVLVNTDSEGMSAAKRAIKRGFGKEPVLVREGGSIPVVLAFKQILKCDSLLLGWGLLDDNIHSPNEKFSVRDFYRGIKTSALFMEELAASKS